MLSNYNTVIQVLQLYVKVKASASFCFIVTKSFKGQRKNEKEILNLHENNANTISS